MSRRLPRDAKSGRFLLGRAPEKAKHLPEPDLTDPDNPEWTEDDFHKARPATDLPEEVRKAFPRTRGRPRKAEPKVVISIRLSPEVIKAFKSEGPGWQTRIDEELRRIVRKRKVG